MENQNTQITERDIFIDKYKDDVAALVKYLPWLESAASRQVATDYDGSLGSSTLVFPVYDGTLMQFIRTAQSTSLMDRNYPYAFRRYRLSTPDDIRNTVKNASYKDDALFRGVLSKFVMEGQRKSGVWQEAVQQQYFLSVILRMKELIEIVHNQRLDEEA